MAEGQSAALLALLEAEDVASFNAKRGERAKVALFAADLAGKSLRDVDLSGADCDKADLTGTDLSEANVARASFAGADATGAILRSIVGVRSRWCGAWLDQADLTEADLVRADLSEAVLAGSTASEAQLAGARLREVDASGARWVGVDLSEAQLTKANFSRADLTGANLAGASGPGANLLRARLDGIQGRDLRLPDANLREASLIGAQLAGANLANADLSGADLSGADLSRANLMGARLVGARMSGACLADAALDGADLTAVDLSGVDLTGVDPSSLGLTPEQQGALAPSGVGVEDRVPDHPVGVRAARHGEVVVLLWEQVERLEEVPADDDAPEPPPPRRIGTVRVLALHPGGSSSAVLPVPLDAVLGCALAPASDGFLVAVVRARAGGPTLVQIPLSAAGVPADARSGAGGYESVGAPVLTGEGALFGLARRGPTATLHRRGDAGWQKVRTDNAPTAHRFVSRHHPILACKGGVLLPLTGAGPGKPLKSPPGFHADAGVVVPSEDRWLAVWFTAGAGRDPATLRGASVGLRGSAEVDVLARVAAPRAIDALGGGEPIVGWLDGDQPMRHRAGAVGAIGAPVAGAAELVWAPAVAGPPAAVITAADGAVVVREVDGRTLYSWSPR